MRLVPSQVQEDIEFLKKEIFVLRETIEKTARRKPHSCPVCLGDTVKASNLDIHSPVTCLACKGRGIIWG